MNASSPKLSKLKDNIEENLQNTSLSFWQNEFSYAEKLLIQYINTDENKANITWFLTSVCSAYKHYLEAYQFIEDGDFFDAWCKLETVEIELKSQYSNQFLNPLDFHLDGLQHLVTNWQKTYPYKYFVSPEFLNKRVICSVCKSPITPWNHCGHKVGIVYCGQMCFRIIEECELLRVALVTDPVQKFSALHTTRNQEGNEVQIFTYDTVKYVFSLLKNPFDQWKVNWTKTRHPHERFLHCIPTDFCPCESGKLYESCCLSKDGVLRPHMEIILASYPESQKPAFGFVDRA